MHKILFTLSKTAIERLFSDMSVDRSVVLESFRELLDFIQIRIKALENEIKEMVTCDNIENNSLVNVLNVVVPGEEQK